MSGGKCLFRVWAPYAEHVELHLLGSRERMVSLEPEPRGYHTAVVDEVEAECLYRFRLEGGDELPDPASRSQPDGVHGPSQVVVATSPPQFPGLPLEELVFYELHVGTFTPAGTFDGVAEHLDELVELGITAVELMPVAQFPGERNWGYDGVFPFAPQNSYGGPAGLRRLVRACHDRGLALILDVVYNHFGPEGARFADYGPYLTDVYHTPWGRAVNLDGPFSDEVRRYFIENALHWIVEYGIDGLRLDALHALIDRSAEPFLRELAEAVRVYAHSAGRHVHLIAESDTNDASLLAPFERGGMGLDAHWNDDLHHALHALLTGERAGYYESFGDLEHLARALEEGYVYGGRWSPYRRRRHGSSSTGIPANRLLVYSQTHDQVGNRPLGERLSGLVPFEALKLAAATVVLSPYLPLLFMGEEYGETAPFLYFVDHSDPVLVESVRRGRREEFADLIAATSGPEPPDPQDPSSFERSRLGRTRPREPRQRALLDYYRGLLTLRRADPALACLSKEAQTVAMLPGRVVMVGRRAVTHGTCPQTAPPTSARRPTGAPGYEVALLLHFGREAATVDVPTRPGPWRVALDSAALEWAGPGTAVPPSFHSEGIVQLRMGALSAVLLATLDEQGTMTEKVG